MQTAAGLKHHQMDITKKKLFSLRQARSCGNCFSWRPAVGTGSSSAGTKTLQDLKAKTCITVPPRALGQRGLLLQQHVHRREHPQCFSQAFDKRKSSQCLLQEPNLLFFFPSQQHKGDYRKQEVFTLILRNGFLQSAFLGRSG